MSKTDVEIEVKMTPEQVEGARANLLKMYPEMAEQIREMTMVELVKLAWVAVTSQAGFSAENVTVLDRGGSL